MAKLALRGCKDNELWGKETQFFYIFFKIDSKTVSLMQEFWSVNFGAVITNHCTKRWSLPWRISSVNATKSVTITEEILNGKVHFLCTADLVTFTEQILNGKLHFLCSEFKVLWIKLVVEKIFIKLRSIKLKKLSHTVLQSSFFETAVNNTAQNWSL